MMKGYDLTQENWIFMLESFREKTPEEIEEDCALAYQDWRENMSDRIDAGEAEPLSVETDTIFYNEAMGWEVVC
jgi:hypothetical protein